MESSNLFWEQYKAISNRLKKRFMKKPNIYEAAEEYNALARQQITYNQFTQAATCYIAASKCEESLKNYSRCAATLTEAARQFLAAERETYSVKCLSYEENLQMSISCYLSAIKIYLEQNHPSLAVSLYLELGDNLKYFKKYSEAIIYFQKAADLLLEHPFDYLCAVKNVASCQISMGDYFNALDNYSAMWQKAIEQRDESPIHMYNEILHDSEISLILLLMILEPTTQHMKPEHSKIIEKYVWDLDDNLPPDVFVDESLFMYLQSVVLACQTKDIESLTALEAELCKILSFEHQDLFRVLVKQLSKMYIQITESDIPDFQDAC